MKDAEEAGAVGRLRVKHAGAQALWVPNALAARVLWRVKAQEEQLPPHEHAVRGDGVPGPLPEGEGGH